jgi:hypothetical protein
MAEHRLNNLNYFNFVAHEKSISGQRCNYPNAGGGH